MWFCFAFIPALRGSAVCHRRLSPDGECANTAVADSALQPLQAGRYTLRVVDADRRWETRELAVELVQ
ncbi:MAG: hypothetical protein V4858_04405 [Pseudomonadota bacterium]